MAFKSYDAELNPILGFLRRMKSSVFLPSEFGAYVLRFLPRHILIPSVRAVRKYDQDVFQKVFLERLMVFKQWRTNFFASFLGLSN